MGCRPAHSVQLPPETVEVELVLPPPTWSLPFLQNHRLRRERTCLGPPSNVATPAACLPRRVRCPNLGSRMLCIFLFTALGLLFASFQRTEDCEHLMALLPASLLCPTLNPAHMWLSGGARSYSQQP